jgi:hypothetical protein
MSTKAGNSSTTQRPSESRVAASRDVSESWLRVGYPPICWSSGRSKKLVDEFGGVRTPVIPSSARIGAQTELRV